MMNFEAFAQKVLKMTAGEQNWFWVTLGASNEFTYDEIAELQKAVALYDMFHNPAKYEVIKNAVKSAF